MLWVYTKRNNMMLLLLLLRHFSHVQLCATPQTAAHQALLSLGFSRQKYWSGLPFSSPVHSCMLSCFSRVRLCATPQMAAHQAPQSLGFSRQEHWNGLPFPSPMHESAKGKHETGTHQSLVSESFPAGLQMFVLN